MDDVKLHEKLKLLIEQRSPSQAALARKTGLRQPRIHDWCQGKGRLYVDQAMILARALDVPLDYLADETMDGPPPPVPGEKERLVREVAARMGWDWVYWRLIDAGAAGDPSRPAPQVDPEPPRDLIHRGRAVIKRGDPSTDPSAQRNDPIVKRDRRP